MGRIRTGRQARHQKKIIELKGNRTMKKYNITVNGTTYAVEVEDLGGAPAPAAAAAPAPAPAAAPAPAPAAAPAPAPAPAAAPAAGGAASITAPMPGTVLDVKVSEGQAVNAGDVVLILEAMKMENEISAPSAGTVDKIVAAKGSSVNSGDVLITLK